MTERIVFMGSPDFAAQCLFTLIKAQKNIVAVYTQPPKPKNRGQKLIKTPVHTLAEEHGIPVFTPVNFKHIDDINIFRQHKMELAIVVAYGLLLPNTILTAPKYGCINIHASILPRWRGAAPIQRAIEAGDKQTGICFMKMNEGLDTGDVYFRETVDITLEDTAVTLHNKLLNVANNLLLQHINSLTQGKIVAKPQGEEGITYAKKITKHECIVTNPTLFSKNDLYNKIRAFSPFPGIKVPFFNDHIKILVAKNYDENDTLQNMWNFWWRTKHKILLKTKDSYLEILELQKPGGKPQKAVEFLNGIKIV